MNIYSTDGFTQSEVVYMPENYEFMPLHTLNNATSCVTHLTVLHSFVLFLTQSNLRHQTSGKTSQVTYVTMVPRVGNETLRPLGVATGNTLSVTRSEDTYEKTPPVGRRQPMMSLPACHNISAAGRKHHQLLRLKLASEAWLEA